MKSDDQHAQVEDHIIKRYELHEFKGKGAYGIVWKATDKVSKKTVALKKVFDAFQNSTDAQRTFREVVFLTQLTEHDNIVKLLAVIKAENNKDLYMVFEYMETDLHKVIRAGLLNTLHMQYIIYQLLKCLKYIHSGDLIHRDLKPSNLLIDSDCQVKVADFGLARSVSLIENDETDPVMTEYVATRWYRAPEILFGSHNYSKAVDIWSVGCILGEMIVGKAIFAGTSTLNQIEKVIELLGRPKQEDVDSLSAPMANQILSSIQSQKKKSFAGFFQGASEDQLDFMRLCLTFNPKKRITVQEALNHRLMKDFKDTEEEKLLSKRIEVPVSDNKKLNTKYYRDALYQGFTLKDKNKVSEPVNIQQKTKNANSQDQENNVSKAIPNQNSSQNLKQQQDQQKQMKGQNSNQFIAQQQQQQPIKQATLPNNVHEIKQNKSQSFHSNTLQNTKEKDKEVNYLANNYAQYLQQQLQQQKSKKYSNQIEQKEKSISYQTLNDKSSENLSNTFPNSYEEIPTVHKSYSYKIGDTQMPTATKQQQPQQQTQQLQQQQISPSQLQPYPFQQQNQPYLQQQVSKPSNGFLTEYHSKDQSRSISSGEKNKQIGNMVDVPYNFNHQKPFYNPKQKLSQAINSTSQNGNTNISSSVLASRQSKQAFQSTTQSNYSTVKTPDLNNYVSHSIQKQPSNQLNQQQQQSATKDQPFRSKSYEKQNLLKVTPYYNMERQNSKTQQKVGVQSPYNSSTSNTHSRQKTSVERVQKNNIQTSDQQVRQQTQPQSYQNFQSSLNSVQKLLAQCTNIQANHSKKPSYPTQTYQQMTSASFSDSNKPKPGHNKSYSQVDQQVKYTNYFDKNLHYRTASYKKYK